MIYLRARFYEPGTGRFLTRDIWDGNSNQPMSLNSWLYTYGNPVNHSDPSGYISCENSNDAACIQKATELKAKGGTIKMQVTNGSLLPGEGFAQFADTVHNPVHAAQWIRIMPHTESGLCRTLNPGHAAQCGVRKALVLGLYLSCSAWSGQI